MRKIPALFCLVLIGMLRVNAQTLVVFPGDANANGRCSHADLLQIGQSYLFTGPPRNAQDIVWSGHTAQPWAGSPSNVNAAHSDCNGDGLVDRFDVTAIDANFGQPFGTFISDNSSFGTSNDPTIQINLVQDSIFVQGQTMLTLSLELGSPNHQIDSIYGLAITISYDPQIVDNVVVNWTGGFIGDTVSNPLLFSRADTLNGKIYLAVSATDHVNRMGHGTIGTIGIVMDDNIRVNGQWNLLLQPTYVYAITSGAAPVNLFAVSDTLTVLTGNPLPNHEGYLVYPNPASNQFIVRSSNSSITSIHVFDTQGRLVAEKTNLFSTSEIFETDRLAPGCYLLEVHSAYGIHRQKLVLQSN